MKNILAILMLLFITSCSLLNPISALSNLPNPLEADKGINTNVAIGKDVETSTNKSLVSLDKLSSIYHTTSWYGYTYKKPS